MRPVARQTGRPSKPARTPCSYRDVMRGIVHGTIISLIWWVAVAVLARRYGAGCALLAGIAALLVGTVGGLALIAGVSWVTGRGRKPVRPPSR